MYFFLIIKRVPYRLLLCRTAWKTGGGDVLPHQEIVVARSQNMPLKFVSELQILPPKIWATSNPNFAFVIQTCPHLYLCGRSVNSHELCILLYGLVKYF